MQALPIQNGSSLRPTSMGQTLSPTFLPAAIPEIGASSPQVPWENQVKERGRRFASGLVVGAIAGLVINAIDPRYPLRENALKGIYFGAAVGGLGILLPPSGWFLDTLAGIGGGVTGLGFASIFYPGPPVVPEYVRMRRP